MKPVQIEDLFDYRFLSSVEISPHGEWAAFVIKQADVQENGYRSNLTLAHLTKPEIRQLTTSGKDGPYVWEASGDSILFASKRKENAKGTALYRIRVSGGEAVRLEKHHSSHVVRCQRFADAGRMASHQVALQLADLLGRNLTTGKCTKTGIDPV